jgi:hypothetical protein
LFPGQLCYNLPIIKYKLLEELTPEEQAEVATFAMFIVARRNLPKLQLLTDDISADQLTRLVEDSGSFDWLAAPEEDIYSVEDGRAVRFQEKSVPPKRSIFELKGLGKEVRQ